MKLKVIIPNSGMASVTLIDRERMLNQYAMPDTEISVDCIDGGPESIESAYDEVLAGKFVLDKAAIAQKEGYDAIIVYCGSDPAVEAVREIVDIPVIGPGKVSKLIINDLAYKYSILTVLESSIIRNEENARKSGLDITRLASIRSINIPVSDLRDNMDKTFDGLFRAGKKAIEEDGAHGLILSCLGMAGMGARLQEALNVPVIDPASLSIKYAEMLVSLGLKSSKKSFPIPPEKARI